jgi:ParB family chromosome partitioning protein
MNEKFGAGIGPATVLIEFENDDAAVEYLKQAASDIQFEHRASELRVRRKAQAAYAVFAEPYADEGFTILPYDYAGRDCDDELIHADSLSSTLSKDELHAAIAATPQAWAVHINKRFCYIDARAGTVIDEELIDWFCYDDDAEPGAGLIHPKHTEEDERYLPDYYCIDTAAAGVCRWADIREAQGFPPGDGWDEWTAEQKEARQERQKNARLDLLGEAAAAVRRAWVRDRLLSSRKAPKGAAAFIASQQAGSFRDLFNNCRAVDAAAELLGDRSDRDDIQAIAAELTDDDPPATVTTLGLVLGAMEAQTSRYSWPHADIKTRSTEYLQFLADNGYDPAPVEHIILGDLTADDLIAQSGRRGDRTAAAGSVVSR